MQDARATVQWGEIGGQQFTLPFKLQKDAVKFAEQVAEQYGMGETEFSRIKLRRYHKVGKTDGTHYVDIIKHFKRG
jgi:hypothetical protein